MKDLNLTILIIHENVWKAFIRWFSDSYFSYCQAISSYEYFVFIDFNINKEKIEYLHLFFETFLINKTDKEEAYKLISKYKSIDEIIKKMENFEKLANLNRED